MKGIKAMNKKIDKDLLDKLYEAVILLETKEECKNFFLDLCTINELKAMSQRLQVAKMLKDDVIYQKIADETGASTATISRVSRSLNYGTDGYNMILEKLEKKDV